MKFADRPQTRLGIIGEGRIAKWAIHVRGDSILPVYEKEMDSGKGPVLFSPHGPLIAPDMLVYNKQAGTTTWVEAKTKTGFTWHRISQKWVTGLDIRHYQDYLRVAADSPWPVWVLFLHLDSHGAKETPQELIGKSPVGLFGRELIWLSQHENHRSGNYGSGGMVYWAYDSLKLLAMLDEIPA